MYFIRLIGLCFVRKLIALYSEIRTKLINTLWEESRVIVH